MKIQDVPQDMNKTYQGHGTKAVYAVDDTGAYTKIATSGWDVEEVVLRDVLADFERLADDAKQRALNGLTAPIEYFVYKRMMDIPALANAMGMAKWKVKRHLKPKIFKKLSDEMLQRYADLLRIDLEHLKNFKETTTIDANT
jgi:hypothetical protein